MRCFDVNLHNKKLDLEWICDKGVTKSNKKTPEWTPDTHTKREDLILNQNMHTTSHNLHKVDLELKGDSSNATKHEFQSIFSTHIVENVTCWNNVNNKDFQLISMCVFVTAVHLALAIFMLAQYSNSHADFFYLAVICCYPISILFTKQSTTQLLTCSLHVMSVLEYIQQGGKTLQLSTAVYVLYMTFLLASLLLRLNRTGSASSKMICIVLYVGGMFAVLGLWVFRQYADQNEPKDKTAISSHYTINVNLLADMTASVTIMLIVSCESLL